MQGFASETMIEHHDVLQSHIRSPSIPVEDNSMGPVSLQPQGLVPLDPTFASTTGDSMFHQPLYKDCQLSCLQSNVLLLNLQTLHKWSNESMDDLLRYSSNSFHDYFTLYKLF